MNYYARLFLLLVLANLHDVANGFSVSITCSIDNMQIFVGFDERFHGRLTLRPNNNCFLDGQGRRLLLFSISLQAALTERCAIMQLDNEYMGILEVQMNKNLIVASDSQFLVKCPTHIQPSISHNKHLTLPVRSEMSLSTPSNTIQTEPIMPQIGQIYSLNLMFYSEIGLPSIRVGQCLAFLGNQKLDVVELTDMNGCSKNAQLTQNFHWTSNWQMLQTEIEMFNATADNHFYLQCQLRRCPGECLPILCDRAEESDVMIDLNVYWVVSTRVDIINNSNSSSSLSKHVSNGRGCSGKGECSRINIYLIVASLLVLCVLTLTSWIVACWLKPKCFYVKILMRRYKVQSNGTPSSFSNGSKRDSNVSSLEKLNIDELIRENHELKMHTLTQIHQQSNDSPSSSSNNQPIYKNTNSSGFSTINDQFLTLDALPEPPSVSVEEIQALNRAFNKLSGLFGSPKSTKNCQCSKSVSTRSERSNSFDSLTSCSSNTTLDINVKTKRPVSASSTVDVRLKGTGNATPHKPNNLQITSLKSLTQPPKTNIDNDLKEADQKLNDILTKLRAEVDQKRQEANNANADWLNLLKIEK